MYLLAQQYLLTYFIYIDIDEISRQHIPRREVDRKRIELSPVSAN